MAKQLLSNSSVELPGIFGSDSFCKVDSEVSPGFASTIHLCVAVHTAFPKPWRDAITLRDAGELLWIKITYYLMADTGCSHRSWLQIASNFYAKICSPPDEIHLNLQFIAKITWHPFMVVISAFMA